MNEQELLERAIELMAAEMKNPFTLWYLSYADDNGFRGGLYIQAFGPSNAALRANLQRLSPGGEVLIIGVPLEQYPDSRYWNRLLTRAEIEAARPNDKWGTIEELEPEEKESE